MGRLEKLTHLLRFLAGTILAICAYWNVWTFDNRVANLPARDSDVLVVQEARYKPIRQKLAELGYGSGNIAFLTNRGLRSESTLGEDDQRWTQAQYVMVPWILLRNTRSVSDVEIANAAPPYVIGDFWDGVPPEFPKGLLKLYDAGGGLILFRRIPSS